ncbi:helix-turn-helix domain-containing protein [Chitinophaga barathri]|nr:helix-turn-helix domain-containing protein [Chitinophaga barathri]
MERSFPSPLIAKAYDYYLKGLTAKETAKLLDISPRTVQRYIKAYGFEERAVPATIRQRVIQLHAQGFSLREIADIIQKSRTTVYKYLKAEKQKVG